jgi:hypothetical protein
MEQIMDRVLIYPGAIPLETDLLATNRNALISISKLASALFGSSTLVSGFAVTPTGPASLQVVVAPGEIYSLQNIDGSAYSSIAADTAHSILKQGIALDSATLNCPAPTTTGQSINYLVQVAYQDVDAIPVVLPYYNASNPSQAYSGPENNGVAQNTRRNGVAVISVKAGVSATTGSQSTPSPDVGYVGLYAVTVAFAQTTITSANIVALATKPQINATLFGVQPAFAFPVSVPLATQPQHAVSLGQISTVKSIQKFTASGSYTVPDGVTKIWVSGCAAGGGGSSSVAAPGSSYCTGGSGGGAGQSVQRFPITVTPGQVIPVTIGNAGNGGTAGVDNATDGGATRLGAAGSLLNLLGGTKGRIGVSGTGVGSLGLYSGPDGGPGYPKGGYASDTVAVSTGVAFGGFGGLGGSTPFGQAGQPGRGAANSSLPASPGYGYGAGGSGAGGAYFTSTPTAGAAGAAGLPGYLEIES